MTASTTVNVEATYVCLTKITLMAYTGATWLIPPASISPIASVTAQLQPLQVLSAGHFEIAASVMAALHRIQLCCMSVKQDMHKNVRLKSKQELSLGATQDFTHLTLSQDTYDLHGEMNVAASVQRPDE